MSLADIPPSITRVQGLVTFLLIAIVGLTLGLRTEVQQNDLERQQTDIAMNTQLLLDQRYDSCVSGIQILARFNAQQDALAKIEQRLVDNPSATPAGKVAAQARVKTYKAGRVLPLPICER